MKKQKKGKQSSTDETTTEKVEETEIVSTVENEKADYIAKLEEHNQTIMISVNFIIMEKVQLQLRTSMI